jgi:Translocon-associated protein beta (TRAPB)
MARARLLAMLLLLLACCAQRVVRGDDADVAAVLEEDEYVDPSAEVPLTATLVVHKRISQRQVVKGRNLTVSIAMYNVGTGCASLRLPRVRARPPGTARAASSPSHGPAPRKRT